MSIINPVRARRSLTHLLLAGHNPLSPPPSRSSARQPQSPANPFLTPVPFSSWLGSIGRASDVLTGWSILPHALASGLAHSLVSYESDGVHRVFAAGRNEMAQLALGFNSHESTRGLVEGFEGDGIESVAAGAQSSYMLLRDRDSTAVWVFGSLQRGRLGHPGAAIPGFIAEEDEPELKMLAKATRLALPEGIGRVQQMAVGFEHLLLLSADGQIFGTGCNTDGQLGLGHDVVHDVYELTRMPLPPPVAGEGVVAIRAGADTSALLTSSGSLWTWGNSEYAQGLHGRKIDQIHMASLVPTDSFLAPGRKLVDFRCGGSFSLLLDDQGSVYSAGFGALGLGPATLESHTVQRIPSLEGITRIRAGWGWAAAIRDAGSSSSLFTFGLNNAAGRLGVGRKAKGETPMHVHTPIEVVLPIRELGLELGDSRWVLGEVEVGQDALWATIVEDTEDDFE